MECVLRNCEGPAVGVEGFGREKTLRTSDARGPTMVYRIRVLALVLALRITSEGRWW